MPTASNTATNIIPIGSVLTSQEHADLSKLPTPIASVNQKIRMVLTALLNHCFDQCNDALFHAADTATNTADQNSLFDANRTIREQQAKFSLHFLGVIDADFSQLVARNSRAQTQHLQEPNSWNIAIENIANDCIAQNQMVLASISTRFKSMLKNPPNETNPLHPTLLLENFSQQVLNLNLPANAQTCVCDVFQKSLFQQLPSIYSAIDDLLDKCGIPQAKNIDSQFTSKYISQLSQRQPKTAVHVDETIAIILNSVLGSTKANKKLSRKELIKILDVAQRELGQATAVEVSSTMIQLLNQTQKRLNIAGELSSYDSELIKLVGVMFEVVTRNNNLEAIVKGFINRLQVAVIKVALIDKSFFSHSEHDVRKLLNELVVIGLGWNKKQDPNIKSGNIRLINKITSNIVENFGTDISTFSQALAVLKKIQQNEAKQLSLLSTRLHGSTQGKAKARQAETIVNTAIKNCLDSQKASSIVQSFATKLWCKVMMVTAMDPGTSSPAWQTQSTILIELCQLTTACKTTQDKIARSNRLPKIFAEIQQALTHCAHNAFDTAEILEELHRTLCECLKGNDAPQKYLLKNIHQTEAPTPGSVEIDRKNEVGFPSRDTTPTNTQAANSPKQANTAQPEQPKPTPAASKVAPAPALESPADKLLREQVMQFPRGALFNWEEPVKGTIRCQLAAIIKQTNHYIFVNRNGIKVVELPINEVISAIKSEQLKPFDNSMVFDKALEEVVTGLRRSQAGSLPKH